MYRRQKAVRLEMVRKKETSVRANTHTGRIRCQSRIDRLIRSKQFWILPRNKRELALYGAVISAIIKFCSNHADEKPSVQNIINIYMQRGVTHIDPSTQLNPSNPAAISSVHP